MARFVKLATADAPGRVLRNTNVVSPRSRFSVMGEAPTNLTEMPLTGKHFIPPDVSSLRFATHQEAVVMPTRQPVTNSYLPDAKQAPADCTIEPAGEAPTISMSGIVDAILEVGRQRNSLLHQLRTALQSGRDDEALSVARQLCGMSSHEESNRINTRIN